MKTSVVALHPTFLPDVRYLHRVLHADIIVLLDTAPFAQYINVARTPFGNLIVPLRDQPRHTKIHELRTERNNWQNAHVRQLAQWYATDIGHLGCLLESVAHFTTEFAISCACQLALICRTYLPARSRQIMSQQSLKALSRNVVSAEPSSELILPAYGNGAANANWSIIDLVACLGTSGAVQYFRELQNQ